MVNIGERQSYPDIAVLIDYGMSLAGIPPFN